MEVPFQKTLAMALGLAVFLGLGRTPGAEELRPGIPSPPGSWARPIKAAAPARPTVRAFPAAEINKLLAGGGYARTRFVQERLRGILPPGSYRFDARCPLVKHSPPADPLNRAYPMFTISCLDREHQAYLAVPIAPDKTSPDWKLLFQAPQSARMTATLMLSLQKREWDQSGAGEAGAGAYSESGEALEEATGPRLPAYYNYVYHASTWLWHQRSIEFQNSFLRILQSTAAQVHFDRFGTEEHLALVLPRILKEAERRYGEKTAAWTEEFLTVIPRGRWFPFQDNCPLVLEAPPRRAPGDDRFRMTLRVSCIGKTPLARAELLLDENFFRNYPGFDPVVGTRFLADLKFGGITRTEKKYRLDWDGVNNLRPVQAGR